MRRRAKLFTVLVSGAILAACQISASNGEPPQDSTDVLQSRFDALRPGDSLTLEPGIYRHSGVLKLRVPGVHIDGNNATLQATEDATSSVQILADDVTVTNLRLSAPPDGPRMHGIDQQKLVVSGHRDNLSRIAIFGSAAAGVFVDGAQDFTLSDISVTGTRADGVHMTNGAQHGVLTNITTAQTGDDGVAVVSYYKDAAPCNDITVSGIDVRGNKNGRGLTVVGGTNVTMRDFAVSDTDAAGVYVATEAAPYFTRPVDNVSFQNGTIARANQATDIVHGAILVVAANPGTTIQNVNMTGIAISGTGAGGQRNVAVNNEGGTLSGINFTDISLDNAALPAFADGNVPPQSYRLDNWSVAGAPAGVS